MSVSYASSEIIVEIIDITEKCSPGFVLITQVTARMAGLLALLGRYLYRLQMLGRITRRHVSQSVCNGHHRPRCPERGGLKLRATPWCYTVALGAFASPSSSPRFLARYAETFALFMHRSEQ